MNTQAPAIILIEKDEVTLEIYQRELSLSFNVYAFTDLTNVLDVLAHQEIKAIIIEPEICAGQGWEFIDTLHETLPDRMIPIIVCSTRDATRGRTGINISLYLTKPVLPRTLREKVLEILGSAKKRR